MSVSLGSSSAKAALLDIRYRRAKAEDIAECLSIELASYPPDEAASNESLEYRQANASPYFLLCTTTSSSSIETQEHETDARTNVNEHGKDKIIGFVCGTRCTEFTEESMSTMHVPSGPLLAIHSVVVQQDYRRRGIATAMLKKYIETVIQQEEESQSSNKIESMVLLSKQHLLGFYQGCGFTLLGPSSIVHGKELWYELEQKL